MADVTVERFAKSVGISVIRLQEQLNEAGISSKSPSDSLSDAEKTQLLSYLRKIHGKNESASEPDKITLRRKTVSEIKVPSERRPVRIRGAKSPSSSKTVSIEVRKKRTYVKRKPASEEEISESIVQRDEAKLDVEVSTETAISRDNIKTEPQKDKPEEIKQTKNVPDNNLPINQEGIASETAEEIDAEALGTDRPSGTINEHQSKAQGANPESSSDFESIEKEEDAKTEAGESSSTNEVNKAPLKDTSNIRKGPKNKEKKSYQKEDREELHVAIEKSGKRRKKICNK